MLVLNLPFKDLMFLTLMRISLVLFLFFFSSRRRHTRCSRDWSSDVCSSDLRTARVAVLKACSFQENSGPSEPDRRDCHGGASHESDQWVAGGSGAQPALEPEIGRASCRERV